MKESLVGVVRTDNVAPKGVPKSRGLKDPGRGKDFKGCQKRRTKVKAHAKNAWMFPSK